MFQKKIDEHFSTMPNVFSIADGILIAGFREQGKDHDETLDKVLRQVNSKLNKDKCLFRCTSIPFFGEIISQQRHKPRSQKSIGTNRYAAIEIKERMAVISAYIKLSTFSPVTTEVFEFVKTDWIWNRMYQDFYDRAK